MSQATTDGFDYQKILDAWSCHDEQQKADFLEHLYQVYQPADYCYTGLWQRFLNEEAGPYCRHLYFERLEAVKAFNESLTNEPEKNKATAS